ncbi:hypothetical protein EAO71_25785 [Streptomyces sp. ms191]|nr:hypothetical protein EAO71_25785 [Streptomyces sp. ms191]
MSQVTQSAPRTRGGGPRMPWIAPITGTCSPHPRGWSPARFLRRGRRPLLPAPAGVVPKPATRRVALSVCSESVCCPGVRALHVRGRLC